MGDNILAMVLHPPKEGGANQEKTFKHDKRGTGHDTPEMGGKFLERS
jgi:hypothetical protein